SAAWRSRAAAGSGVTFPNRSTDRQHRALLLLRLHVDRHRAPEPLRRKVVRIDEAGVGAWVGCVPAVSWRRDVRPRLSPAPCGGCLIGSFGHAPSVGPAAVMVYVVDERHSELVADRQQVARRE